MVRKIYALTLILIISLLAGCNTARGFGEDVQHLGGAIERATK